MAWVYLIAAAIFELIFAVSIKLVDGFSRPGMLALTVIGGAGGLYLMSLAVKTLPIGIAYPVWTAMAIVGVVIFDIVVYGEPATLLKIVSVILIVIGVAGLRAASPG